MNPPIEPGIFNLCYSSLTAPENWLSFDHPAEFLDNVIRVAKEPGTEIVGWFTMGGPDVVDICNEVVEVGGQMWDDTKQMVCARN